MDEARYQQLMGKRNGVGLSDEEAAELGRLMAEKAGKPYGDHSTAKPEGGPDAAVREALHDQASDELMYNQRTGGLESGEDVGPPL